MESVVLQWNNLPTAFCIKENRVFVFFLLELFSFFLFTLYLSYGDASAFYSCLADPFPLLYFAFLDAGSPAYEVAFSLFSVHLLP